MNKKTYTPEEIAEIAAETQVVLMASSDSQMSILKKASPERISQISQRIANQLLKTAFFKTKTNAALISNKLTAKLMNLRSKNLEELSSYKAEKAETIAKIENQKAENAKKKQESLIEIVDALVEAIDKKQNK